MEPRSLTQKTEQAVVAMMESHDAHRAQTRRFSLLLVGSALLHVVAVIALLRSWSTGPAKQTVRTEPEPPKVVADVQVVRLELAVAKQSATEVIKMAQAQGKTEAADTLQLTAPDKTIVK